MSSRAHEFASALAAIDQSRELYTMAEALDDADRASLGDAVLALLDHDDAHRWSPGLETLLAYMDVERWPEVIAVAMRDCQRQPTRTREDAIDEAGHQVPEHLNPWVELAFGNDDPPELRSYAFRSGQISRLVRAANFGDAVPTKTRHHVRSRLGPSRSGTWSFRSSTRVTRVARCVDTIRGPIRPGWARGPRRVSEGVATAIAACVTSRSIT